MGRRNLEWSPCQDPDARVSYSFNSTHNEPRIARSHFRLGNLLCRTSDKPCGTPGRRSQVVPLFGIPQPLASATGFSHIPEEFDFSASRYHLSERSGWKKNPTPTGTLNVLVIFLVKFPGVFDWPHRSRKFNAAGA
jgi:hypothetical protein